MTAQSVVLSLSLIGLAVCGSEVVAASLIGALLAVAAPLDADYLMRRRRHFEPTHPYRLRLDRRVRAQWSITAMVGLAAVLTAGRSAAVITSETVAFLTLLLAIAATSIYVSSLIDWFWVLPRVSGIICLPPCQEASPQRWTRVTQVWLCHRAVATFLVLGAAVGIPLYASARTGQGTVWLVVGFALLILVAGAARSAANSFLIALNPVLLVGDIIEFFGRLAYVVDISAQGVKLTRLEGADREFGQKYTDFVPLSEMRSHPRAAGQVPPCAAQCRAINWYCRHNLQAFSPASEAAAPSRSLQDDIEARLQVGLEVELADLPAERPRARQALISYAREHQELALVLAPEGDRLGWARPEQMAEALALTQRFEARRAARVLAGVLGLRDITSPRSGLPNSTLMAGRLPSDRIFRSAVVIAAIEDVSTSDIIGRVATEARRTTSGAQVALLLCPTAPPRAGDLRPATTVIVMEPRHLLAVVRARRPRDRVVEEVLIQADLTKANPFQLDGPITSQMFFGRQQEAHDLIAMLDAGSAAVLGARKIGKTSLLLDVERMLTAEGWDVVYADIHSAASWIGFAQHVRRHWGVEVADDFAPDHVASIIEQLKGTRGHPPVIMLDEVDDLLAWDRGSHNGHPPEAFARICRTLSQEGRARFVFAGERGITERSRDPSSPYWNFCRQLAVRQLNRADGDALLEQGMGALGVRLERRDELLERAWHYTSGHPQLIQRLGDELVRRLDRFPPERRRFVTPPDLVEVAETSDYRDHYTRTYWGQANLLEKAISMKLGMGADSIGDLLRMLRPAHSVSGPEDLLPALRMLELYGIIESVNEPLTFRAKWMRDAMHVFAGEHESAGGGAHTV